jgi:DNA-binding MarR family transcriptional regulator
MQNISIRFNATDARIGRTEPTAGSTSVAAQTRPPAEPDPPPDAGLAWLYLMPGHLIRRSQQVAVAIFAEELGGLDVTPVQFATLAAIAAHPGIDATRVSTLIAFDRSTLGDVLDRIEAKGWIERQSSPQDKRVKSLRLTPSGRALFERAGPAVERTQERILEPLSPDDRVLFIRLLRQLVGLHTGEDRYAG